MLRLSYTALARRDLLDIWLDIAVENPDAAERVYDRGEARKAALMQFPELGPLRPEIEGRARMLVESPYLILYRVRDDSVQIVRVVHGARHIDPALFQ